MKKENKFKICNLKKIIVLFSVIIIITLNLIYSIKIQNVIKKIFNEETLQNESLTSSIGYEVKKLDGNNYEILITVSSVNGIESIKYVNENNEEIELSCSKKLKVTIDRKVENLKTYYFTVKRVGENEKIEPLYINEQTNMEIKTAQDLKTFCDKVNIGETFSGATVQLLNDIDLSSICSSTIGNWIPIGDIANNSNLYFAGTFNGNGHQITNLYINNTTLGYRALFGAVKNGSVINLTVNGNVTGGKEKISGITSYAENSIIENCMNYAGIGNVTTADFVTSGIAGYIKDTTVRNCKNYGTITTTYQQAGGIVGTSEQSDTTKSIENCENYGAITSTSIAGGIVGYVSKSGTIKNCYNGDTTIKTTTNTSAGGIAGYCGVNGNIKIESCNNIGYCESKSGGSGGILGGSGGITNITGCTNSGKMYSSGSCAAGILGYSDANSQSSTISYCKNTGFIKSDIWASGGIAGNLISNSNITYCSNKGEINSGNGNCGGILGAGGTDNAVITTYTVDNCFNTGYIHADGKAGNPSTGGIIGTIQFGDAGIITNCYNTNIVAATSYTAGYIYHGAGGILGTIFDNATQTATKSTAIIKNCYNLGNITNSYSSSYAGQIIGRNYTNYSVTNSYYLSTASGNNTYGGISVVSATLKGYAGTLGTAYKSDSNNLNNGYPILSWQT